jgi:hypothetical protein
MVEFLMETGQESLFRSHFPIEVRGMKKTEDVPNQFLSRMTRVCMHDSNKILDSPGSCPRN